MSTEPDRDPVTDALLRKALQPAPQIGTDGCVDAETLAAWADGNLPANQAAEVEAHLAGCSRCQAVLGAFAMTDDSAAAAAAPASVIPFRPKSPVRWLLPLAASIAATLVLWSAVRDRTTTSAPELQQTQAKAETPPPAAPPADAAANRRDATSRATPVPPSALTKKQVGAVSKDKERTAAADATKTSAAPRPTPAAAPIAAPTGNVAATPTTANRALAPPPPPAVAAPPVQVASGSLLVGQQGQRSMAETVRTEAVTETASKIVVEFTPRTTTTLDRVAVGAAGAGGGARGGGGRGGGGGAAARSVVAPAQPAMPVRWRIMGSGQVMKSTNGGDTWVAVPLAPPIFIVSGDAPSPSVCWLAGRAGVVMRSTDATTFSRIVFPDASDLRSINATDARQATVTTATGEVYMTTDGGETWRKIGLQGFRPAAF